MADVVVVDLFAGAGGLGIGAARAGCEVRLSVELDPAACETLRKNEVNGRVIEADVCGLSGEQLRAEAKVRSRERLLIVGGPPCQPFSKAAYWTEAGDDARWRRDRAAGVKRSRPAAPTEPRADERRSLVDEYWRLVAESKADGFLFENVPSITHPRNVIILDTLRAQAHAAGYETTFVRANAVEFGVPQRRERVFLLGSRTVKPQAPQPTHFFADRDSESMFAASRLPAVTAGEALAPFASDDYHEPEEIVKGRWADHLREVLPGMNYKFHTAWFGHKKPTFVTETRFWNFLLKLSPNLPSWTIAANPGPWIGPFHWESRRLRTAELAALQTFPPGYVFAGSRRERVRQIGNAVPSLLAAAMVQPIVSDLQNPPRKRRQREAVNA